MIMYSILYPWYIFTCEGSSMGVALGVSFIFNSFE